MKNLVPVSHVVGAHAGGPTNLWDASLASRYLEMAAWLTLETPATCITVPNLVMV